MLQKLGEILVETVKGLGLRTKTASDGTPIFQHNNRTFGFNPKAQDTGQAEINLRAFTTLAPKTPDEFGKLLQTILANVSEAVEFSEWHANSLRTTITQIEGGKRAIIMRYMLGENEDALVVLKSGEDMKGICDFLIAYEDAVKVVEKAVE